MPANRRRTFTLTEMHDDLIEYLMNTLDVDASKALRAICDIVIDNYSDIAAKVLDKERRMKQLELKMLDARISKAKKTSPPTPIAKPVRSKPRKSSSDVRTLESMSPEEIIANYLPDVLKDTGTGRIARQRIKEVLTKYPEKLSDLPKEVRMSFEPGGE